MSFQDFLGNTATVTRLRESVRAERFPHSLILAGPRGAGKYTLSLMLAKAVNCLNPTENDGLPDFCGRCRNCERIGDAANLEERVAEAVAAREEMRDADKRDTRILIQTHPDVLIVPPDPPQLLIKLGQVRQVIHVAYYRPPVEAVRAFTIFTSSAFMKEAANSLLKVLEEPPEHTSLILLTENPQELLPTIRSRAVVHRLGALIPVVDQLVPTQVRIHHMHFREVALQLRRLAQEDEPLPIRREARRAIHVPDQRPGRSSKHRNRIERADIRTVLRTPRKIEIVPVHPNARPT